MTTEPRDPRADNALKHGLFTTRNCVQPEELSEYNLILDALWVSLAPAAPLEELYAMEIVRASWRLRRCVMVEATLALRAADRKKNKEDPTVDPMLNFYAGPQQVAVDRARAQAHCVLRRATSELQRLQAARRTASERPEPAENETTKQTEHVAPATPVHFAAPSRSGLVTTTATRTDAPVIGIPRGAPCPCNSGQKYKRCCGTGAPAVLGVERPTPQLRRAA